MKPFSVSYKKSCSLFYLALCLALTCTVRYRLGAAAPQPWKNAADSFIPPVDAIDFRPVDAPQLWPNAPPPPSTRDMMMDPMIVARAAGLGFQQAQQYIDTRKSPGGYTTVNPALVNPDEPAILNGVCSIPSLNPCVANAKCIATVPIVGRAACVCPAGYGGDGKKPDLGGEGCVNVDECRTGTHNCDDHTQDCIDVQGSFYCKCKSGFSLSPSGKVCLDIDECQNPSLNNCNPETTMCHNLEGSFRCDCKDSSMMMDPDTGICRDLDECNELGGSMNPCEQICINKIGGVSCSCMSGYTLSEDGRSCQDVDECAYDHLNQCDSNGVISRCMNTVGGYICQCNNDLGYKTAEDGISCKNINECYEYPYICGGALSCCQDLVPPQRFACSMPVDDNTWINPTDLSNTLNTISSPFTDAYSASYNVMNTVPVALTNVPSAIGRLAAGFTGLPVLGALGGFSADETHFDNSFYGEEIVNKRRLEDSKIFLSSAESTINTDEEVRYIEENGKLYVFIAANNLTSHEIVDKLTALSSLFGTNSSPKERRLQFGFRPRLLDLGTTLMRPPMINSGNGLFDLGGILGPQALGGGGATGGLRIARGSTCPYGFTLGGDLYRARIRESTKQIFRNAVTSRMSLPGEEAQLIQPEYFSDGLVENTKLFANELSRWYSELTKAPTEVIAVAADELAKS